MLRLLRNRLAGRLARTVVVCGLALAAPLAAQEAEETSELPFLLPEESDSAEYDSAPSDGDWVVESTEIDGEELISCVEKKPTPLADAGLPSGECSGDCSTRVKQHRSTHKIRECQDDTDCPMNANHKVCVKARKAAVSQAAAKCGRNGGKGCVCWPSKLEIFYKGRCKQGLRKYCKYECIYVIQGNCDQLPQK